jgi:DNA-binding NarL/FixJ family response regulator
MPIRIVVAEAETLISDGLARSLEDSQTATFVTPATQEALQHCRQRQPCVLLATETLFDRMDLRRFREVTQHGRAVQALAVGTSPDPRRALRFLRLGCMGYVSRCEDLETLRRAVRAVWSGELWAPRVVITQYLREILEAQAQAPRLTGRQREILELIHRGYTNEQIANLLYISGETLRWHMRRLLRAIGARDRRAAAEFTRNQIFWAPDAEKVVNCHQLSTSVVEKNHLAEANPDRVV